MADPRILAEPWAKPEPWDLWSRANIGEVMPGPVSELAWSHFGRMLNDSTRRTYRLLGIDDVDRFVLFRRIDGYLYINAGAFIHLLRDRLQLPVGLFTDTIGQGASQLAERERPRFPWLAYLRLGPRFLALVASQRADLDRLRGLRPTLRSVATEYGQLDLTTLEPDELFALYQRLAGLVAQTMPLHLEVTTASFGLFSALDGILHQLGVDDVTANDLLTGISDVASAAIAERLWQIAANLPPDVAAMIAEPRGWETLDRLAAHRSGAASAAQIHEFLRDFGHRAADELEIASPRWADDPSFVLVAIDGYFRAAQEGRPSPRRLLRRQQARRAWAIARVHAQLASRVLDRGTGVLRYLFDRHLQQTEIFVRWRENGKHELLRPFYQLRRVTLAIGARLEDRGELAVARDVFGLRADELAAAIRGESHGWADVAHRRGAQRAHRRKTTPPDLRGPDLLPIAPPTQERALLTGLATSQGIVRGQARVLSDLAQSSELAPGEVLVAAITDPGWTPLFAIASAVVVERGGLLSHGAIVAREYGIPAVVGVPGLLDRVQTGMLLEVDGTAGRVLVL